MSAANPPAGPTRRTVLGLGAALVAAVSGCTPAEPQSSVRPSPSGAPPEFRFALASTPKTLDPALAIDSESQRVTRQVFEGLVGVDPNTGAPTPALATSWEVSGDGLEYVFRLRRGVVFHDGTAFDADAVVANFERWAGFPARVGGGAGLAFESVFHHHTPLPAPVLPRSARSRGEALPEVPGAASGSAYGGCAAIGGSTVRLRLRRPITGLIEALTMPGFGIASPRALRRGGADDVGADGSKSTEFGRKPIGTGPFTMAGDADGPLRLEANPNHWATAPEEGTGGVPPQRVLFRVLRDSDARLRALENGGIDAYDMVTAPELRDLVRGGRQIIQRDPFTVLYLGLHQDHPVLADPLARRAAAHAVDRRQLIERHFIAGTTDAHGFIPPSLGVPDPETRYGFDPDRAAELLREAGYDGEPIPFAYPLRVTRGYLPLPERIYADISRQLTAAGFRIRPVPIAWDRGYLDHVLEGRTPGFHLLGQPGAYRDPDHFVGSLFGGGGAQFGHDSPELRARISAARSMPNSEARTQAYARIGELIAEEVPAVPLAFPISAVAAGDRVVAYPSSPVLDERYDRVRLAT